MLRFLGSVWFSFLLIAAFAAAPASAAHHEAIMEAVESQCVQTCNSSEDSCNAACPTLIGLREPCLVKCADAGEGCRNECPAVEEGSDD